ncbi:hypothetical protein Emtol_0686 [Emticicia oligotrophica DSM 17448]|jgi:hypothetical protein|uniref:Uncharacterized protein n=1 Tax=Emticicia oligotrophica (strain DSM 17448 / CIP 109782 / MTCC 6937 / GPTSA100-15) TaxID=929562 RepID=A0ABN4AIM7_EMTOG|nr:hypothetical protein [Emticicia oligotrophica]AFK01839.1 hypothetical protein Emtol_0686 [Emticicia oligotrophica DSM 17448]
MSYNIQVYTAQTMVAEMEAESEEFFDNDKNLIPFTEKQKATLKERLIKFGFELAKEDKKGISFKNEQFEGMRAILTNGGLYIRSSFDDAFEIGMLASELTDTGEFAKYDPQADGWEVLGE